MVKGGVYKKRKVHRERGRTQVLRGKEETGRTLRDKRVNSNNSYVSVVSLGQFVLRKWFIPIIRLAISSLFFSLGGVLLYLFVSLSYKFIVLGHGWTNPATILSGLGLLVHLVPTIMLYNLFIILITNKYI